MRGLYHLIAALSLCLALSACNTPDALTPKADVPGADNGQTVQTTQMTERQDIRRPLKKIDEDDSQPVDNGRAPQNTMEAQQQALERGEENPSLTKPDTVVAQNNQDSTVLSANLYKSNSDAKPASSLYSAAAAKNSIRFLPIIGAPVQAVTPLSRELGNSARANGLVIKGSSDQTAEHVLKGYLSAFADGKKITVVYVWDVLDNAGSRLHRIQGQETVSGKGSDAWSSVPPELMQQIGDATIAEYMKWLQSQG
jgi:flagellar capping protein FliD